MEYMITLSYSIQDFVDQGGPVLWVIFAACLLMWLMILDRIWYLRVSWPRRAQRVIAQ